MSYALFDNIIGLTFFRAKNLGYNMASSRKETDRGLVGSLMVVRHVVVGPIAWLGFLRRGRLGFLRRRELGEVAMAWCWWWIRFEISERKEANFIVELYVVPSGESSLVWFGDIT